jgi:hypothetical protein
MAIDPGRWIEFVPGARDGKRVVTLNVGQHEYVFVEQSVN